MPLTEQRTQIYLTTEQHSAAKRLAARRGVSLAGVIREALGAYLAAAGEADVVRWAGDPVAKLAAVLELPPLPVGEEDLDEAVNASVYDEV